MKQKIILLLLLICCTFSYSQKMTNQEKLALKQFIELLKINVDASNNSIHPYIIEGLQLNGYILKKSAVKSKLNEVITNQQTRNTFLRFLAE